MEAYSQLLSDLKSTTFLLRPTSSSISSRWLKKVSGSCSLEAVAAHLESTVALERKAAEVYVDVVVSRRVDRSVGYLLRYIDSV